MYYLVYIHDIQPNENHIVLHRAETLKEIAAARNLSGDLVVDHEGKIVEDTSWLFDWELRDLKEGRECYAYWKIKDKFHFHPGWRPGCSNVSSRYNGPEKAFSVHFSYLTNTWVARKVRTTSYPGLKSQER